jgi:hypothetical protein
MKLSISACGIALQATVVHSTKCSQSAILQLFCSRSEKLHTLSLPVYGCRYSLQLITLT